MESTVETHKLCPHFGECGGCQFQDEPYTTQLDRKRQHLKDLLIGHWQGPLPIHASPMIWHYRNKVDPAFDRMYYPEPPPKDFPRETALGFKRKGKWYATLDLQTCLIAPEGFSDLVHAVRSWVRQRGLKPYNTRSKQGYLRFLLVRDAKRTGHRMVVLITAEGDRPDDGFVDAVQTSFPATSIQWGINTGAAEVAIAEKLEVLHGTDTIEEELHIPDDAAPRVLRFRLSPFSFFQTNSLGAEHIYGALRAWTKQSRPNTLYDLYGGSGAIGLACADSVGEIVSVESVASATSDGEVNAQANGVNNMRFVHQEVERFLHDAAHGEKDPNALAVLDPPRAGLHPKALTGVLQWKPREIHYVSCNPESFARELPSFADDYQIIDAQAVDMFPHTKHVELLVRMIRR